MTVITTPINLVTFEVITPNVSKAEVETALRSTMNWLKTNQKNYYENELVGLADKVIEESIRFSGSLNSLGRKIGIKPKVPAIYQPYNLAEMFRTTILMKAVGYTQNHALYSILGKYDMEPTVEVVLSEFKHIFPFLKTPKWSYAQKTINSLFKTGVTQGTPTADGVLPFWATDTHYSKVTRDNRVIYFTFKIEGKGSVTLKFILPANNRFKEGKLTRPTVFLGRKNEIRFGFTLQTVVPAPLHAHNTLGVDLGRVEPYVATLIIGNTYSQPIMTNKQVNLLTRKIVSLGSLSDKIWVKENINELKNHKSKQLILKNERLRIRSKISRLKLERAHRSSTVIVNIAKSYNATILLENLSWVPNSKWEQSIQQATISDKANKQSVPVKKINPKNTSQTCPRCNNPVTHSNRVSSCNSCSTKLNRDILASRNIAHAINQKTFNNLTQTYLTLTKPNTTRYSEPVTTGAKQPNYATKTT